MAANPIQAPSVRSATVACSLVKQVLQGLPHLGLTTSEHQRIVEQILQQGLHFGIVFVEDFTPFS